MKKLKTLTAVFAFAMFANLFGVGDFSFEADDSTIDFEAAQTVSLTIDCGDWLEQDGDPQSSDESIATVSGTTVTFLKPGVVTITQAWEITDFDGKPDNETGIADSTVDITAIKVTIEPSDMTCTESLDSGQFEIKVKPSGITPTSYKWLTDGAYPSGATFPSYKRGGEPNLKYSASTEKKTYIKKTRWFAKNGSRLARVDGPWCEYEIPCEVEIEGITITPLAALGVEASYKGEVSMTPPYSGNPKMKKMKNKWTLLKNDFKRAIPKITLLPISSSQFYDKTFAHEQCHITQWNSISPWKDLYNINKWWSQHFSKMTGKTHAELQKKFIKKLTQLCVHDNNIFIKKKVEMELQAWHVSNAKLPNHLELTDDEIKKLYGKGSK